LVGTGPHHQFYEEMAFQLGIGDMVQFCGSQADPRPHLLGSDIFVLASHAEPGPLVLAEAREAGCAIIATSVGGIPEMLDGGDAGVLVPPRRPDLLADAIIKVLHDKAVLADMRARSRLNLEHFTVRRASEEYISAYKGVLS
jgi:glycosyltransferase involved in cell wall biosynthesis